jgi:hypothetical protein
MQSSAALQSGIQEVAQQAKEARKELNWIATGNTDGTSTTTETSTSTEETTPTTSLPTSTSDEKGKAKEEPITTPSDHSSSTEPSASPSSTSFNFLSKLQSSIPPSLVSTVQNALPESLKQHATHPPSVDFAALRSTLSSEFQRVQGLTRAQAEEYVHRSEGLIREAVKQGGEFFKDAVRVVPPDADAPASQGVFWDGTDVWAFEAVPVTAGTGKGKERIPPLSEEQVQDAQRAVATRAEALLKRLRSDPEILKADPDTDQSLQDMYPNWVSKEVVSKDGGINGPEWKSKINATLADGPDGKALQATYDALGEVLW